MSGRKYRQQQTGGYGSHQGSIPPGYTQGGGLYAPVGTTGYSAPYNPQTAPHLQGNWPGYNRSYGNPQGQQAQNTAVVPYYPNAQDSRGYGGNPGSGPWSGGHSHPQRRHTTHEPQYTATLVHRVNGNNHGGVVRGAGTHVIQNYHHGDASPSENPTPLPALEPVFDRNGNPVNVFGEVTGNCSSATIMDGAQFTQNYLPRRSHTADVASSFPMMDRALVPQTQYSSTKNSSTGKHRLWNRKGTGK